MVVNGVSIDEIFICNPNKSKFPVILPPPPVRDSDERPGNPPKSLRAVAGFVNSIVKETTGLDQPIETGGHLEFWASGELMGAVQWVQKPGTDRRETLTVLDKIFPSTQ